MNALRTLFLALFLTSIGFFVGYGYQARGAKSDASKTPAPTPQAPQIKGLHASPDGKLIAFTGVYARSERGGVWILNPATGVANGRPSPAGWQDYVTQWRADGHSILLEREKIPRPAAEAKAGIYLAPVERQTTRAGELSPIGAELPRGEKIVTGILAPGGELVLKTKREPKSLFLVRGGVARAIDQTAFNYGQNRPVREGKKLVLYAVRDVPNTADVALYRIEEGRAQQISPAWNDVSWSYVAPSGKQILVARIDENEVDWNWTLYQIAPSGIKTVKSATVPADVISVYWSQDEKRVLGAAGEKLWSIDVPSLKVRQIGQKSDWNADDASWIDNQSVAVAQNGEVWRVEVPSGRAVRLWRFPDEFWN
ncbi:hypothetical protein B1R32_102133 [Abditibacterium utsteinense]|uniref:WD40-like Beta Propeller Repeat n=1 Tax=Abditibacterium utsteinense TaxID=1960156 RepID=A0A2S8SWE3_9BACT|nr:hypothetical protein [Abditibacterium utsteinense]PQV65126.1 hypothetical protein B1R32_102133 [Abditibacterium utsteinense]